MKTSAWAAQQLPADGAVSDLNTIVVVGSRIARNAAGTVEPASIIDAHQIATRGYTNLADALSENPAFAPPENSVIGGQALSGVGQTMIGLFSLGAERTLTLVDGHRFVSSNPESASGPANPGSEVDLNLIPEALIDRAETIAVGGAPVYGSDAIAGTVNIILKRSFQGVSVDVLNGLSQRGDGAEHRVSAIAGTDFAGGRGHIVMSGQWNRGDGLTAAARQVTSSDGPFFDSPSDPGVPYANQLYRGVRLNVLTPYGVPLVGDAPPQFAGIVDSAGYLLSFNAQGRLVPYNIGEQTGSVITSAGGDGFRVSDYGNLRADTQRTIATALASFDVSDALGFYADAWYAHSRATNVLGEPYFSSILFGDSAGSNSGNLVISLNNPFLSAADRAKIARNLDFDGDGAPDSDSFLLARADTDLQNGRATTVVDLYRIVVGAKGQFRLFGHGWSYDASVNYGYSRSEDYSHQVVAQNLFNALDATRDPNGNIVCDPGYTNALIKTFSSTCAPFDPFGQSTTATHRAAIDYITAPARSHSINTTFDAVGSAQGTVFVLPGGDAAVSVGYEHRRESVAYDPGVYFSGETLGDGSVIGWGESDPVESVAGAFHTDEMFGEVRLPIVAPKNGIPFLSRAELEGAVRYVHNSLAGGGWTYTIGGTLAPIPDVTLRGNYTRSIRAPSIAEALAGAEPLFDSDADPCDARFIGNGPDPARRAANCAAVGITQPFTSNFTEIGAETTISGNPDLKNERADSYTVGTVLRPHFVPGLTLSADYVSIRIGNAIQGLVGANLLDACYDSADYPNNPYCARITRDASGQIMTLRQGPFNAAVNRLKAVTVEAAYHLDLARLGLKGDPGAIDLTVHYYHLIDQYVRLGADDINHSAGEIGNPRDSFVANLNYTRGPLSLQWQTQYMGPSVFDADADADAYQIARIHRWFLFDTTVACVVTPHMTLRLIVDNVFNSRAPFAAVAGGGFAATEAYYAGVFGRSFKVTAGVNF